MSTSHKSVPCIQHPKVSTVIMSEDGSTDVKERRSERKRSSTCAGSNATERATLNTGVFTEDEKALVLSALYTHGSNVDKIAPLLSSRSREQVRDFLTGWYRRVKKIPVVVSERDIQTSMVKVPIELWLEKIRNESSAGPTEDTVPSPWYPYTLGYIAKYENHPNPSVTGGVNFRKLYEFLESALLGNMPQDLSFSDALFMLSSLRKLKLRLEKVDFHKEETHLTRSSQRPQPKTYKRIKKEDPDVEQANPKELEDFLSTQRMNPLKMPLDTLCVSKRGLDFSQLYE